MAWAILTRRKYKRIKSPARDDMSAKYEYCPQNHTWKLTWIKLWMEEIDHDHIRKKMKKKLLERFKLNFSLKKSVKFQSFA